MAIADDYLDDRIRQSDPVNDEQPPDTPAAPKSHRPRWVAIAGIAAVASVAIAGFALWPSSGETSAAAIVRDAVAALDDIDSYQAVGDEVEPGVRNEAWSLRVDGDDASFFSQTVFAEGGGAESALTYLGDAVYVTSQGQTELRPRPSADGIDTRFHELLAALTAALDGAEVTEATTDTFAGVEMTRYYVVLTEQSIASLSAAGTSDLIPDPGNLEELRVCVADDHHMHEVHFVYHDGGTIDVTVSQVNANITINAPQGLDAG